MSSQIDSLIAREYAAGFVTDIETDTIPPGLNEDVVREISRRKQEPAFMLEWRVHANRRWLTMSEPHWPNVKYPAIDYQAASYFSPPKSPVSKSSLDEVDPAILQTPKKVGM